MYREKSLTTLPEKKIFSSLSLISKFHSEGNGGNKSLPAREGTLEQIPRGGDGDDHHQSWKVKEKTFKIYTVYTYI